MDRIKHVIHHGMRIFLLSNFAVDVKIKHPNPFKLHSELRTLLLVEQIISEESFKLWRKHQIWYKYCIGGLPSGK